MTNGVILERSFPQGLSMSDGRTVEGRCVPYGVITEIWSPDEGRYKETFDLGVFARVTKAPERVIFRITHADAYANMVGYGTDLEERDDGLYGSFRLLEADAPKARELIRESYRGLSVGFLPINSKRHGDVLHRITAHLDHVAAVVTGTAAYSDAMVLAMRQKQDHKYHRSDDHANDDELVIGPEMPNLEDDEALKALQAYNADQRAKLERIREMVGKRA